MADVARSLRNNRSTPTALNSKNKGSPRVSNGTSNRFTPLQKSDDNETEAIVDTQAIIDTALGALPPEAQGTTKLSKSTISGLVTAIVSALVPIIKATIESTTSAATSATVEKLKTNVQVNTFRNNHHEQYTRKDNLKIVGLIEKENEDTMAEVVDLCNDAILKKHKEQYPDYDTTPSEGDTESAETGAGARVSSDASENNRPPPPVLITRADISIAHRNPSRRSGPRPIVARFVRRETKDWVMKNRGGLKDHPKGKIFLHDDLTDINNKMLWALRNDEGIERAWSFNSVLWAMTKPGTVDSESKKVKIESPDDLVKVGFTQDKIEELDLYHLY